MPKNLVQSVVFGVLMVVVMVYFMICYNIAMDMGVLQAKTEEIQRTCAVWISKVVCNQWNRVFLLSK